REVTYHGGQVPRQAAQQDAPAEAVHERTPRRRPRLSDSRGTELQNLRSWIQIALRTQDDHVLASVRDPLHQPHVFRKRIQGRPITEERLDPDVATGEIVEE